MFLSNPRWIAPLCVALCSACVLAPAELKNERDTLARAGERYAFVPTEQPLQPLPSSPGFEDLLRRTFLGSGELAAAWHDWRAAIAEVTVASAWPNTNLELDLEHVFSGESGSAWDRTSWRVGFDAADALELPAKTKLRGRIAFNEARAAAERFRAAKFSIERRFTETYVEWVRARLDIVLSERTLELLQTSAASAERNASVGPNALGIARGRIEIAARQNEIEQLRAEAARLETLVLAAARVDDDVRGTLTSAWPDLIAPSIDDATWIALAARSNPALAEFAHEVAGRSDALELARAQWWPDIAPFAGFTGGVSQFIGATASLPTATQKIRASVEVARARLDGVRSLSQQSSIDVRAGIARDLISLREAERSLRRSSEVLRPLARELTALARAAYAGGTASQLEWLDALRAENDVDTAEIAARAARETSLVRLQEWVGLDLAAIDSGLEVESE